MIRMQSIISKKYMFVLLFAGLAAAVITGLIGGNQQVAAAGECGSGYVLKKSAPINQYESRTGTLEVYWSSSAGKNCAIARCYGTSCGSGVYRVAKIKLSSQANYPTSGSGTNSGWFYQFAGPVYSPASGNSCIDAYGSNSLYYGGKFQYYGSTEMKRILCS